MLTWYMRCFPASPYRDYHVELEALHPEILMDFDSAKDYLQGELN